MYVCNCVCVLLQYIPMSVLYGVFLFMGVSSVKGIQVKICNCKIEYNVDISIIYYTACDLVIQVVVQLQCKLLVGGSTMAATNGDDQLGEIFYPTMLNELNTVYIWR